MFFVHKCHGHEMSVRTLTVAADMSCAHWIPQINPVVNVSVDSDALQNADSFCKEMRSNASVERRKGNGQMNVLELFVSSDEGLWTSSAFSYSPHLSSLTLQHSLTASQCNQYHVGGCRLCEL